MTVKKSYGVACFHNDSLLLVRKPCSYALCELVRGVVPHDSVLSYISELDYREAEMILVASDPNTDREVVEKIIICIIGVAVPKITYRFKHNIHSLLRLATKFTDVRQALIETMHSLQNKVPWILPRGGFRLRDRTPLAAAVREFTEETGLLQGKGFRLTGKYLEVNYSDLGKTFSHWYAYADFTDTQPVNIDIHEVLSYGWFTRDEIINKKIPVASMQELDMIFSNR